MWGGPNDAEIPNPLPANCTLSELHTAIRSQLLQSFTSQDAYANGERDGTSAPVHGHLDAMATDWGRTRAVFMSKQATIRGYTVTQCYASSSHLNSVPGWFADSGTCFTHLIVIWTCEISTRCHQLQHGGAISDRGWDGPRTTSTPHGSIRNKRQSNPRRSCSIKKHSK
jgi:hypothetical protein